MDDRQLLELAAKAAGVQIFVTPDGIMRDGAGRHPASNAFSAPPWNPLTDDGDALRLAVKLKLNVLQGDYSCGVNDDRDVDVGAMHHEAGDPYAATRRAIVRAAAEIGKY